MGFALRLQFSLVLLTFSVAFNIKLFVAFDSHVAKVASQVAGRSCRKLIRIFLANLPNFRCRRFGLFRHSLLCKLRLKKTTCKERKGFIGIDCLTIMCLCINNDDLMHNKCYFLLNYRKHFYHCNYLRSLKSDKTAHKILIAAQKLKKI